MIDLLFITSTNNSALISYQNFIKQSLNGITWPISSALGSRSSCNKGSKRIMWFDKSYILFGLQADCLNTPVFDVADDKRDIKACGSCTPLLLTGATAVFAGTWVVPFCRIIFSQNYECFNSLKSESALICAHSALINQSINQSVYRSIDWSTNRPINQSINQSGHSTINLSICSLVCSSVSQASKQVSNYSISPSVSESTT